MSASREALRHLTDALAAAVAPHGVVLELDGSAPSDGRTARPPRTGDLGTEDPGTDEPGTDEPGTDGPDADEPPAPPADADAPVRVHPVRLTRAGRSTRSGNGPTLELELAARVVVVGPQAVDLVEQVLVALEGDARYVVEPLPEVTSTAHGPGPPPLGCDVVVRVPVALPRTVGPRVREPLVVEMRPAEVLAGTVVGDDGGGIRGAVVRARPGGPAVVTDADGRFRVLGAEPPTQKVVVEVRGTTRVLDVDVGTSPVVVRWEWGG